MGTIADKLAKLNTTKEELKAALAEKGQTVGDVFSAYPAAVRAIETGGGTCTGSMQFSDKRGVKYIYIGDNGESKVSSSPITDNVMIGSILVVCYSTALAFPTTSGGIKYITDLDYDGVSSEGNAYLVSGNFSIS